MNELLKMKLFSLLAVTSQEITIKEMQNSYENFCIKIKEISNTEDYANIFRILSTTRIELASIEMLYLYEQEKKCSYENVFS